MTRILRCGVNKSKGVCKILSEKFAPVFRDLIDYSKEVGREVGVYITKEGSKYTITEPQVGEKEEVVPGFTYEYIETKEVPENVVASFHTHPEIEKGEEYQISWDDLYHAIYHDIEWECVGLPNYTVECYKIKDDDELKKKFMIEMTVGRILEEKILDVYEKVRSGELSPRRGKERTATSCRRE